MICQVGRLSPCPYFLSTGVPVVVPVGRVPTHVVVGTVYVGYCLGLRFLRGWEWGVCQGLFGGFVVVCVGCWHDARHPLQLWGQGISLRLPGELHSAR